MIRIFKFIQARETLMKIIFAAAAFFSLAALAAITVFLLANGIPFIAETGFAKMLFGYKWAPIADQPAFGIFPMLATSVYVTALSVVFGGFIGLFTAVCLYKFFPKHAVGTVKQIVNLLAGIPSVVFGLFGLKFIVPFLRDNISPTGSGYGILAASVVLTIMILPTVISVSLNALESVPNSYFEGALALGATKEQAVFRVMLPAAKSGVLASIVLSAGRAVGETMAVIMVIGGSPEMPEGLFQSVRTLTSNIAMGATELSGKPREALIATGVVLFAFTLILNVGFGLIRRDNKPRGYKLKAADNADASDEFSAIRTETPASSVMTKTVYAEKKTTGRYKILKHCGSAAAATTLAALFGVIIYILISGIPHLSFNFLFGKYTGSNPTLAPALSGTLMLLVAALGIAVPIGIATAVFLTEYAAQRKGIVKLIRLAVETLAGIPSIIYGLFGYLVFVVEMGLGYSLLGGGITLAIMILPVIIRSAEESLLSVPKELKEASYALGARKVRTIFGVILPSAASGILTSVVLAAGRVISESAVLILTVGMLVNKMPENFFFPGTSLALNVYFFGSQGYPKQAAATGAALLIIVICINLTAGLLEKRLNKIKI